VTAVCALADLQPGRGVRALVEGRAVAVFRLDDDGLRAVDDVDPYAGASVLSRGLVGVTRRGDGLVRYVASPLRKQRFDLDTGEEVDGPARIGTWAVRVRDGVVHVTSPGPGDSHRGHERETSA
jgi:NAD(P)H-dependent nitrite reductase small subunit